MPKSSGAMVRMPTWIERVGIDDAVAHRARNEAAVVDALAVVGPGVLVGVELDQRQRPVAAAACAFSSGQVTKWSPPSDSRKAPLLSSSRRLALDRSRRLPMAVRSRRSNRR